MSIGGIWSLFYLPGRILGVIQAVRKGPDAVARRIARGAAGKVTGRMLGKGFR